MAEAVKDESTNFITTIQQEYKILAECKMIESEKICGVYVLPSFGNSLMWFGVIFLHDGFYEEAIFRFNILLPEKFPNDKNPPSVIFQSEIFHPLICPFTGSLDLSYAFPQWCPDDHVWQLLKYIKAIFLDPAECLKCNTTATSWKNNDAAELLTQNRALFITKAKENVTASKEHLYDEPPTDDPHYITFEIYKKEIHEPIKQKIREGKEPRLQPASLSQAKGLSWVKDGGEYAPLSM